MAAKGISVVILTLDEAMNLPGALASIAHCNDIVVLDSGSRDETTSIAVAAGARVVHRDFDNYAAQRSSALNDIRYTNEWLLMLDADERVPPDLWAEMRARVGAATDGETMFRMRRKDYFMGRWLRRSSGYPSWFGRLLRIGHVRIEREINEEYLTDGKIGHLAHHLVHYPFRRGIAHWFDRHNRYSSLEAEKLVTETKEPWTAANLFSGDPTVRRRALKRLSYRLPFRPLVAFTYLYFFRLGILDGMAGYRFCRMRATYEYMIDLKVAEAAAEMTEHRHAAP